MRHAYNKPHILSTMHVFHDERDLSNFRLVVRAIERMRKREGRNPTTLIQNFPNPKQIEEAIQASKAGIVSIEFIQDAIDVLSARIRDPRSTLVGGDQIRTAIDQAADRIRRNKSPPVLKQGSLALLDNYLLSKTAPVQRSHSRKTYTQIIAMATTLLQNRDGITKIDPPMLALLTRLVIGNPSDPEERKAQSELRRDPAFFTQLNGFIKRVKSSPTLRHPDQSDFGRIVRSRSEKHSPRPRRR